ncbi:MAG TPA: SgcJ/EcaC family oxidoreductase [Candidatus Acidoferrum sp.]|nr:SgcJ/EcaC family oxidoreductase [Candidatus Acidoferrum sp.]
MNSIPLKAALAIWLFLTFSAASSRSQMASNHDADTAAIKQFVANFADTWNSHDAHGVAMHYVEDGDFSSVKGEVSHGRKELEDHYTMIFTTFLKNAHTTDTVRSIRFLAPDLASVDIDWLVNEPSAPGGVLRKGLLTWMLSKRNGQWMIVIYHEQSF